MDVMKQTKSVIGQLIDIGIALLILAIVLSLLIGPTNLIFFGAVVDNIMGLVNSLGQGGLAGLIVLGIILWLFSKYT